MRTREDNREHCVNRARVRAEKMAENYVSSIGDYTMSSKWEKKLNDLATCLDDQDRCKEEFDRRCRECKYCSTVFSGDDIVSVCNTVTVNSAKARYPSCSSVVTTINLKNFGTIVINQQHYHLICLTEFDRVHTLSGNFTCPACLNMNGSVSYMFSEKKIKH
jgi:hypothetical protein